MLLILNAPIQVPSDSDKISERATSRAFSVVATDNPHPSDNALGVEITVAEKPNFESAVEKRIV